MRGDARYHSGICGLIRENVGRIMSGSGRHIKALAMVLLLIRLCLPISGPIYFSDYLSTSEASHAGIVCAHSGADSGHNSHDDQKRITHCHELDAPCDTVPCPVLEHLAVILSLTVSDRGTLLPGHEPPIEIPPKHMA